MSMCPHAVALMIALQERKIERTFLEVESLEVLLFILDCLFLEINEVIGSGNRN